MADAPLHEVFLELASGTRVLVGADLPDIASANDVARRWRAIAENESEILHETMPGSGCIVRGSAIAAIKAQPQPEPTKMELLFKAPRSGVWL